MADIFICYARADKAFALKLRDALIARQREVWIDLTDLPGATEWWKEICVHIEAADNFIFIISPDSSVSLTCRDEVAYAEVSHKPLIPALHRPVSAKQLPPVLARIQWISFTDHAFDTAFQSLIEALETNVDWVKGHTRMLLSALEWERNGHDSSFLLRGKELQNAVKWVAQAPTIEKPKPSSLQEVYIKASQEWEAEEVARLKELNEESERRLIQAERQERVAQARERVSQALTSLEDDPERSILLALHAVYATKSANGVLPEAEDVLHQAILRSAVRFTLRGHSGEIQAVALTADGRRAASASEDGTLKIWDLGNGRELRTLPEHTDAVAFCESGHCAVTLSMGEFTLKVWDVASGCALQALGRGLNSDPVAVSTDCHYAICGGLNGDLNVWDVQKGIKLHTLERDSPRVRWVEVLGVALNDNKHVAVSAHADDTLVVWALDTGRQLHSLHSHSDRVSGVALGANGRRAVSASWDHSLKVWDVESGRELLTLHGHSDHVRGVAVNADATKCISGAGDGTVKLWNVENGRELRTLCSNVGLRNCVAMSSDGCTAISSTENHELKVWNVGSYSEVHSFLSHSAGVNSVAVSRDGDRIVSASCDSTLKVWELKTGREICTLSGHSGWVNDVAVSEDGHRGLSGGADGTLRVWNLDTGRALRILQNTEELPAILAVSLSADGRRAVSISQRLLKVWDLESMYEPQVVDDGKLLNAVSITADGRRAISASLFGLSVLDLDRGREVHALKGRSEDLFYDVVISSDGRRAVSVSFNKLTVWDVESGHELRKFHRTDQIHALAMSPIGNRLATANDDGTVTIWDVEIEQEIITLPAHSGPVRSVAWTRDGRFLISGGEDGIVQVYAMDLDLLLSLAHSRITRNLTPQECRKYLHVNRVPPIPFSDIGQ